MWSKWHPLCRYKAKSGKNKKNVWCILTLMLGCLFLAIDTTFNLYQPSVLGDTPQDNINSLEKRSVNVSVIPLQSNEGKPSEMSRTHEYKKCNIGEQDT